MIHGKMWIKGYVTSVNDGDNNLLLYHTPAIGFLWPLKFRRLPSGPRPPNQTIRIRLAGVDSSECQLLERDHYGRIVGRVHRKPRFLPLWLAKGKCISLEMLRAGWGTVYKHSEAVYGLSGLDEFERAEREVRDARRGMWQDGIIYETPAQYKQRIRELQAEARVCSPLHVKAPLKASAPALALLHLAMASQGWAEPEPDLVVFELEAEEDWDF
ncbi:hypothetical protein C8Q80DRAFT_1122743 [Daedaleopsis nitida]|nr:hypothetical protein C8Q80DRAFT_1122743 [Daedaleopsis nitida]